MALQGEIHQQNWEGRSHGQLQEIVQRGLAGGDEFVAAVREMERRSREQSRTEELETAESARLRRKRRLLTLAALAAVCFLALIAQLWLAG